MGTSRLAFLALGLLAAATPSHAAELPQPPCAGEAIPTWPATEAMPAVVVLHEGDLPDQWKPAACSGITASSGATVVAVAGRFHHQGDASSLLARIGAVSQQRGILYWSVSHLDWRPLLADASALSAPDPAARRADFVPDELRSGAKLLVLYDDEDEPAEVVFETEIRAAGPDGFVTTARNVTPMRLMGFTIAGLGDLQSMTSVHRVGPDAWDYYALSAVSLSRLAAAVMKDASYVNRAVATYRYVAGIPTDRDPPVALK